MATACHNLSSYDPSKMPDGANMRIGIVVAEWNEEITFALRDGAVSTLLKNGVQSENIVVDYVPGSFELTYGAQAMAESHELDAVIILGCVVRGGTPHFDYVCSGVTQGITHLNTLYGIPFIFGLLTTDDMQQAIDRAGGIHGNKGDEAAVTAIKMVDFSCRNKI
jgi:6,7-dimethyl-8-ribityllumazine synthase